MKSGGGDGDNRLGVGERAVRAVDDAKPSQARRVFSQKKPFSSIKHVCPDLSAWDGMAWHGKTHVAFSMAKRVLPSWPAMRPMARDRWSPCRSFTSVTYFFFF